MPDLVHVAHVCDPVVLRELEAIVARAIAQRDGAELREFRASRLQAYGHLRDAEATPLEVPRLVAALAQIATLKRSPVGRDPLGHELIEAARLTSTHPRDVAKDAYERLLDRATRLERLVQLHAPEPIVLREAELVAQALGAIDHFDLSVRSAGHLDVPEDERLVQSCLNHIYVPDMEGVGTYAFDGHAFLDGPALFPTPTALADLADWERFCGSLSRAGATPRAATGEELVAAAREVEAHRVAASGRADWTPGKREDAVQFLERYRRYLLIAAKKGHCVVEWVQRG